MSNAARNFSETRTVIERDLADAPRDRIPSRTPSAAAGSGTHASDAARGKHARPATPRPELRVIPGGQPARPPRPRRLVPVASREPREALRELLDAAKGVPFGTPPRDLRLMAIGFGLLYIACAALVILT